MISQRRGIISLINKKDKDTSLLENLRPISLLNVDYKILTKVIAKRLEKLLPKIVNPDQTGYVKGRYTLFFLFFFFFIRMLFFWPRLNILIFLPILG